MAQGIQSVEIAMTVLQALQRASRPLSLKDLSAQLAMTPSKTRMYLVSLLKSQMVAQTPSSAYALGPGALSLGMAAFNQVDLVENARGVMVELSRQFMGPTLLTMWSGASVMIVHRNDSNHELPFDFRIGGNVSLTRTATGRIFLAYLPEAETAAPAARERALADIDAQDRNPDQDPVQASAQSPADRQRAGSAPPPPWPGEALAAQLRQIREQGYDTTAEVVLTSDPAVRLRGYQAVAVPVMDLFDGLRFVLTVLYRDTAATPSTAKVESILRQIRQALPTCPVPSPATPG